MLDLEAPFVLAADVVMVAAKDLSERERRRIGCGMDDHVLSRKRSRARSKAVSPEGFDLVRQFQTPKTLVTALREVAASRGQDANAVLELCFPVIQTLVNDDFLVPATRREHSPRDPTLVAGGRVADFTIGDCIQLFEDTELYRARSDDGRWVALKIAREVSQTAAAALDREAALHRFLDGVVNPELLAAGRFEGRAYLAVAWRDGRDVATVADAIRRDNGDHRLVLLSLCIAMLDAFAHLHAQGVIHGDVHPLNVLADDDGHITVLDYGLARALQASPALSTAARGGVGFFFDPDYVRAQLAGDPPPQADACSEQYALAGLVYLLLAGRHHLDFSFDERTAFAQIRDDSPRAFASVGVAPWPEAEAILATALSKSPDQRYASVAEFAARLRQLRDRLVAAPAPAATGERHADAAGDRHPLSSSLDLLLAEIVSEIGPGAPLARTGLPGAGACSVHSGASGIAYALYRIACIRDDAKLLAAADLWSTRAIRHRNDPDAYFDRNLDITEANVGVASVAHSAIGTAFVHALIALASGEFVIAQQALDLFVMEATTRPCPNPDLFLGRAGHLVACASLFEAAEHAQAYVDRPRLKQLGDDMSRRLASELAEHPPISAGGPIDYLGAAHGWSGLLYALMRWAEAADAPVPDDVPVRLQELAQCAIEAEHGVRWPIRFRAAADYNEQDHMTGWCNGGAGHTHTWLLAHSLLGDPTLLDLAHKSAAQAYDDSSPKSATFLCCGMTGVAYALLALHRATGQAERLSEAHRLAQAASADIRSPWLPRLSLFRGALGLALLSADLGEPGGATMPIFGHEV